MKIVPLKIAIIEDEVPASDKLEQMINQYNPNHEILIKLRSVKDSVEWLYKYGMPDLIFMDIHLLDGNSFEIMENFKIDCPVIFTTAYDNYAIDAFQLNSVDYLLKPISYQRLKQAFEKLSAMKSTIGNNAHAEQLQNFVKMLSGTHKSYKNRFLVKKGNGMVTIHVEEICYFLSEEKVTFIITDRADRFMTHQSLDELENLLSPEKFFRINRQMIIHIQSIDRVHKHFNGRLKIELVTEIRQIVTEVLVSHRRAKEFQLWLDG